MLVGSSRTNVELYQDLDQDHCQANTLGIYL